ncbi:hypothetical protein [Sphingomicrobium flavum]|uniref:hypothetical protein n=1 Tax=Sphingomicrobium flavum TaxID=1229164 RepID=UPI0021AE2F3A|nr:hypothetical protein [Sphingomicrobium flavum]
MKFEAPVGRGEIAPFRRLFSSNMVNEPQTMIGFLGALAGAHEKGRPPIRKPPDFFWSLRLAQRIRLTDSQP